MKKISVSNLVIEVGRKCNRRCAHCLRGEGEKVTINLDYVKTLLSQVDWIDCITFTGGEPTLYPRVIEAIIEYIIQNNIDVRNFYVVSNGEIYSNILMKALNRFYEYLEMHSDREITLFDVSNDQFHSPKYSVIERLEKFPFFSQRGKIVEAGIIAEGFAEDNCIGRRYLDHEKKFYVTRSEYRDETEYEFEMLYLNALGYYYADCDYSYETQRSIDAAHCDNKTLLELANSQFSEIHD